MSADKQSARWIANNEWLRDAPEEGIPWRDLVRFLHYYRPYARRLLFAAGLAVAASLPFLALKYTFDRIQEGMALSNTRGVVLWLGAYAAILLTRALAEWSIQLIRISVSTALDKALVTSYYESIVNMRVYQFLKLQQRANLYQRVVDAMSMTSQFTDVLITGLQAVIAIVFVVAVVSMISTTILGIMACGAMTQIVMVVLVSDLVRRRRVATLSVNYPLVAKMLEVVNSLLSIKALAASIVVTRDVAGLAERRRHTSLAELTTDAHITLGTQIVKTGTVALSLTASIALYMNATLTSSEAFTVYVLCAHVFGPVADVARLYQRLTTVSVNVRRFYEVQDMPSERATRARALKNADTRASLDGANAGAEAVVSSHSFETQMAAPVNVTSVLSTAARVGAQGRGAAVALRTDPSDAYESPPGARPLIMFDRVHFQYRPGIDVMNGLSLTIEEGERVSIVGRSGAGKTTLLRLLLGFIPPGRGTILVAEQDLSSIRDHDSYRRLFGVVGQDDVLFEISLRDNLTFGLDAAGVTESHLTGVLRAVGLLADVARLPDGLDTVYQADHFSAGQRQRLCVARALIRQPRIVVLDEPTASLDFENEETVLRSIEALSERRTTITVAHRFSTIVRSHRTLVLNEGRIMADGSHGALFESCDYYRALCTYGTQVR